MSGTKTPFTGSCKRRHACLGYTTALTRISRVHRRISHCGSDAECTLTDGLDQQRRRVQDEQDHVQEVEDGLDGGEHRRVGLEAGKRDVDRAGAHTDGELRFGAASARMSTMQDEQNRHDEHRRCRTHRLPRPSVDTPRELADVRCAGHWLIGCRER